MSNNNTNVGEGIHIPAEQYKNRVYARNQILSSLSKKDIYELLKETKLEALNQRCQYSYSNDPELYELNNAMIYEMYDTYMQDCENIGGWGEPSRTNLFVWYVIGKNADPELEGYDALKLGEDIIFKLLSEKMEVAWATELMKTL